MTVTAAYERHSRRRPLFYSRPEHRAEISPELVEFAVAFCRRADTRAGDPGPGRRALELEAEAYGIRLRIIDPEPKEEPCDPEN